DTPGAERVAVQLGRAVQLTNILRNLGEDAARNRLYLPRELLRARGIAATAPMAVLAHPALADVCRDLSVLADKHFAPVEPALAAYPPYMRPAALMLVMYRALLRDLLVHGWGRPAQPARLSAWRKAALMLRHGFARA